MTSITVKTVLNKDLCSVSKNPENRNTSKKNRARWCINTRSSEYEINHRNPRSLTDGCKPGSNSLLTSMLLITKGRVKAMSTHAAECMPGVPEKRSTMRPIKNDEKRSNQPGVSKGSSKIKKTYRKGLTYPPKWILSRISTCRGTNIINRSILAINNLFIQHPCVVKNPVLLSSGSLSHKHDITY